MGIARERFPDIVKPARTPRGMSKRRRTPYKPRPAAPIQPSPPPLSSSILEAPQPSQYPLPAFPAAVLPTATDCRSQIMRGQAHHSRRRCSQSLSRFETGPQAMQDWRARVNMLLDPQLRA